MMREARALNDTGQTTAVDEPRGSDGLCQDVDAINVGRQMYRLVQDLYPICRSITGNGVRETLRKVEEKIPLTIYEVPTGTKVFDWTVPKEWNVRDAYIKDSHGKRIVDFKRSNLHVVSYSVPIKRRMPLSELKDHLHSLPDYPDRIPYRTTYYKEDWGFCLTHNQAQQLKDNEYEICIDSTLEDGHLTYGECYIPGSSPEEILLSTHVCHPSMCNDNLSGITLAVHLAQYLQSLTPRYSYRLLFTPGTIGSITWLALNEDLIGRIKHGLVLACVGDSGAITYKKSRQGNAEIDRAVGLAFRDAGAENRILDFSPYGYDERQFCSPGINLPMGCLMRTPHGRYPEYHTSADNLQFVRPESLADSFAKCLSILRVLENNRRYLNQNPKCEPQLGRRGLYRTVGGSGESRHDELAMLWVLNLSDGSHSLLDIAEQSTLEFSRVQSAADALLAHDLLKPVEH